ncbi:hypothetical protein MMC11_008328, partial [Xylographa trunciseda]|nr:hypothetical protein [Xylographa trunciseda]
LNTRVMLYRYHYEFNTPPLQTLVSASFPGTSAPNPFVVATGARIRISVQTAGPPLPVNVSLIWWIDKIDVGRIRAYWPPSEGRFGDPGE